MAGSDTDVIGALRELLGAENVVTGTDALAPFETDWRGLVRHPAIAAVTPRDTAAVAATVSACRAQGVAVVPQGGKTGMVAGGVPAPGRRQVVLSLSRLDRIRAIDTVNDSITVDAGCILQNVQDAAAAADRMLPLRLASEGSCQIGGTIATNAGGTQVVAYGSMRHLVLGLEVVLPDGRIWDGLRGLRKDNTGVDLKQLFIGSEGTLGIVTGACLTLLPRPGGQVAALVALPSVEAAIAAFVAIRHPLWTVLTSIELFSDDGLRLVLDHVPGARAPFASPSAYYALIELSVHTGDAAPARETLEEAIAGLIEDGTVTDAIMAESETQRLAFWRLRESVSEAERAAGGSLKHDVAVPISALARFIGEVHGIVERVAPGARPNIFGHVGDGSLHVNIRPPEGVALRDFARDGAVTRAIEDAVMAFGGSISAEHGIGQTKPDSLPRQKSEVELALMRTLKAALDPLDLLNPGKLLPKSGIDAIDTGETPQKA
jgi:FAD/FMN-containing dehydrogenase